jgi:hypothetical protein
LSFGTIVALFFLFSICNGQQSILGWVHLAPSKKRKIQILNDISGIVKPSRYLREAVADLILSGVYMLFHWMNWTELFLFCFSSMALTDMVIPG